MIVMSGTSNTMRILKVANNQQPVRKILKQLRK